MGERTSEVRIVPSLPTAPRVFLQEVLRNQLVSPQTSDHLTQLGEKEDFFTASLSDWYFLAGVYRVPTALPSSAALPWDSHRSQLQPTRRLLMALKQVHLEVEKESSTFCLRSTESHMFPEDLALGQHLQSTL